MNPDPESELVTEVQPRAAVLRAMARRLATSVKSLGAAALVVFGLLGTGLVALVAWRHDTVTVTVAVAAVVVIVVVVAWFRAEAEHLAVRAGYVSFRRRAAARTGYYELRDTGYANTNWGLAEGSPRPAGGGDGGLGGAVQGRGNASGGDGGNGGSGLLGGRLGLGGNGGNGGGGGSVIGRGDALGGRGGAGGFPGGGGGGGGFHGTVTPGNDDPEPSADPPASQ